MSCSFVGRKQEVTNKKTKKKPTAVQYVQVQPLVEEHNSKPHGQHQHHDFSEHEHGHYEVDDHEYAFGGGHGGLGHGGGGGGNHHLLGGHGPHFKKKHGRALGGGFGSFVLHPHYIFFIY